MSADLSKCYVGQPIGQLEDLAKRKEDGVLLFPFRPELQHELMKAMKFPLPPTRIVSSTGVVGILQAVRNLVLDWCLDLERDGILGEGLKFNEKEKQTASSTNYVITYNGPVGTSQVQQASRDSTQTLGSPDLDPLRRVFAELKDDLGKLELLPEDERQANADIETMESQLKSPRPNRAVIRELVASLTAILEAASANVLAAAILHKLTNTPY